jgi:hypothetical protein
MENVNVKIKMLIYGKHPEIFVNGGRYGFCLVSGVPAYASQEAQEAAKWFFYSLSKV